MFSSLHPNPSPVTNFNLFYLDETQEHLSRQKGWLEVGKALQFQWSRSNIQFGYQSILESSTNSVQPPHRIFDDQKAQLESKQQNGNSKIPSIIQDRVKATEASQQIKGDFIPVHVHFCSRSVIIQPDDIHLPIIRCKNSDGINLNYYPSLNQQQTSLSTDSIDRGYKALASVLKAVRTVNHQSHKTRTSSLTSIDLDAIGVSTCRFFTASRSPVAPYVRHQTGTATKTDKYEFIIRFRQNIKQYYSTLSQIYLNCEQGTNLLESRNLEPPLYRLLKLDGERTVRINASQNGIKDFRFTIQIIKGIQIDNEVEDSISISWRDLRGVRGYRQGWVGGDW